MTVREMTEEIERSTLSEFATLSCNSKGRKTPETECELRTVYQRDRDRIIHSKAFRRLKHKTQVFLSPESDHYRTRLTHTLEVSQIARTIARALRLNEDLTEAIALGHDLGHTPFGHAGERALDKIYKPGFTHYEQSIRVCKYLERHGEGLNLTAEVLDGILHHTVGDFPSTPEGKIVRYSDHIAYMNHDFDDAVAAGLVSEEDMPREITENLGVVKSKRIDTLVKSMVNSSVGADIKFDDKTNRYYELFHEFMFDKVYRNPIAQSEEEKVGDVVCGLFEYIVKNPDFLSGDYALVRERDGVERAAADYIAGMTDHYAVTKYKEIYIPKSWKI